MIQECQCATAGYCHRMQRLMSPSLHRACKNNPAFRLSMESRVNGVVVHSQPKPPEPKGGPGTELKLLLQELGLTEEQGCGCDTHAAQMDAWGVEGCHEHKDEIRQWLNEARGKTRMGKKLKAMVNMTIRGLYLSPYDPIGNLIDEAIRRASGEPRPEQPRIARPHYKLRWAYGVTTVRERLKDLLPKTLHSLSLAGFDQPRLFIDGEKDATDWQHFGLETSIRDPKIKTFGNWWLAAVELLVRYPEYDRYAIFQDDFVTYRNLRSYLEISPYPEDGYCNLYSMPSNEDLVPPNYVGWYQSRTLNPGSFWQTGRGAVALVFDRKAIVTVLQHQHMIEKQLTPDHRDRKVDGAIVTALNKAGFREYVHKPSLVQHLGIVSSMRSKPQKMSATFRGEDYDALELAATRFTQQVAS